MSANLLPTEAVEAFVSDVKQAYQQASLFRMADAVRTKRGVEGSKVHFPRIGRTRAQPKAHRQDYVPANVPWNRPEAVMSDWYAAELTDIFENIKVNFDERTALAESLTSAIGRQEDEFTLGALGDSDTAANPAQGGQVALTGGAFATTDTTLGQSTPTGLVGKGVATLIDKGVSMSRSSLFGVFRGVHYDHFAEDKRMTSVDYGAAMGMENPLRGGPRFLRSSHGVTLMFMDDRSETASSLNNLQSGGLAATEGYLWDRNAIGCAFGLDPRLRVEWIPMKGCWLVVCEFSAGAVAVDPEGIVKFTGLPAA